ncbi:hypothetical protein HYQ44_000545 [Verticillium longisporum]|nr:hypothetical protein HYQ44_000545 [Verticillium longisporum]
MRTGTSIDPLRPTNTTPGLDSKFSTLSQKGQAVAATSSLIVPKNGACDSFFRSLRPPFPQLPNNPRSSARQRLSTP